MGKFENKTKNITLFKIASFCDMVWFNLKKKKKKKALVKLSHAVEN